MSVLLIIPAFNEEASIENVVDNIKNNFPQYDYVIINDGSKDKSIDIIKLTLCITVIFLKTCFAIL